MKKLTNYHPGARGINLKDGSTRWIEPGETIEVDAKEIAGDVPDLGKKPTDDGDDDLIASVEAENADLKKQVADLTKKLTEANKS